MAEIPLLQVVKTIDDLRVLNPSLDAMVLLVGKSAVGDGLGGFYRWDATDITSAEETQFMNTLVSTVAGAAGRWVRVFQRAKAYPAGVMVMNGGVRTLYCPTVTDSSGRATVYPTVDGTATGAALFSEIWQIAGTVNAQATSVDGVIVGSGNISTDRKTVTYTFAKNKTTTLGQTLAALLGAAIPGLQQAQASVPVYITLVGI